MVWLEVTIWYFWMVDDPNNDPNASGDPYKTLFVARLVSYAACWFQSHVQVCVCGAWLYVSLVLFQNYETSESKIKREFEAYGPIKQVCISQHSLTGSVRRHHVLFAIWLVLRPQVYKVLIFFTFNFSPEPGSELFLNCLLLLWLKPLSLFLITCQNKVSSKRYHGQ